MTTMDESPTVLGDLETPFAEARVPSDGEGSPAVLGLLPWTESISPFTEAFGGGFASEGEGADLVAEAFEELRDEGFDEALSELIQETALAAEVQLAGEEPGQLAERRRRLADAHLDPIGFEAERCIQRFSDELLHLDLEGLAPEQLDELLDRFDPGHVGVSPAGEEFIGGLVKKAKSVVRTVVSTARKVASAPMLVLKPILDKLKALVRPLLKRVLAIAINKLPAALHEPARALARRFGVGEAGESELELEAEDELLAEGFSVTPVAAVDAETLAEQLDAALAEAVLGGPALEQGESFGHDTERGGEPEAGRQLETLAEARAEFIGRLQSAAEGEDLAPAVEQFIPAILPALRLGIRLVGRGKVVSFLAGFLARLIGTWVGPKLSGPLSSAIVDVGMRVIGLEQGRPGELEQEAAPAMLAATVEDTVRRLSERPEALFEDEDLMQIAVAEAFEQAVAANFPSTLVRPDLRIAPTLGGSFVVRHARQPYAYKKFSRVPEIELGAASAATVTTFGGVTLDAALRAVGLSLPGRFRVHVYEALAGTTLPRLARLERIGGAASPGGAYSQLHPLTPAAAGVLLREPKLGVDVPGGSLRSRHRIAVGQRFFHLEPVGQTASPESRGATATARAASRPSDARLRISLRTGEARLALFFSEADAQRLAATTAKQGRQALLRAVVRAAIAATSGLGRPGAAVTVPRESEAEWEAETEFESELGSRRAPRSARARRLAPALRAALRRQIALAASRALAEWARTRTQEFQRAAQDPASGVTIRIHVRGLPTPGAGPAALRPPSAGGLGVAAGGAPGATVTVLPGRARP